MRDSKKGWLHILIIVAAIALFTFVAIVGVGKGHKGSAENIRLGLDLAGGVSITYEATEKNPTKKEITDTQYKMQKRAETYSTEAEVYVEGDRRVTIDIPGVTDANAILTSLGKAGSIQFIDESGAIVIDGSDIEDAEAMVQKGSTGLNEDVVKLTLNGSGKSKFAKATAANIGRQIAIVYDGNTISAPVVNSAITDGVAIISGQKTFAEAEELASVIRIGALPLEMKEIRSNVVGAKLGLEAINTSLLAGGIGFVLVILFMIFLYRVPGLLASVALTLYLAMELVILNLLDVTLTLPGVAGIILSIGMAVDANVIIFTRMREELYTGKTIRSSIKLGFEKAFSAIIDGNLTTLIVAAVLYFKGSGTIKGFATTLAIGILLSMFTALVVTKFLLNAVYNVGVDDVKYYGVQKPVKVWDFIGNWKKTYALSAIVIIAGLVMLGVNKVNTGQILNYGLDFRGGTSTEITFNKTVTKDVQKDIEALFEKISGSTVAISKVQDEDVLIVKTNELSLDQRKEVESKLISDFGIDAANDLKTESISGSVSDEMKSDAVTSVIISTVCMLIYIWYRFKDFKFGAGSVVALVHDVLWVLTVYAVCAAFITVGNTFIACMLTVAGYSINATIVVFDRIRENKGETRNKEMLAHIVNKAISDTLTRNVNSTMTTLIMVVMLAVLGVSSVREFSIPMIVGIIGGAYSSICISGTFWYYLKVKFEKDIR